MVKRTPESGGWTRNISDRIVEDGDKVLKYEGLRENSHRFIWIWVLETTSIRADGHHHTAEDEQHQEVKYKELINLPDGLEDQLNHGSECMHYCNKVHHFENDQEDQKTVQK